MQVLSLIPFDETYREKLRLLTGGGVSLSSAPLPIPEKTILKSSALPRLFWAIRIRQICNTVRRCNGCKPHGQV